MLNRGIEYMKNVTEECELLMEYIFHRDITKQEVDCMKRLKEVTRGLFFFYKETAQGLKKKGKARHWPIKEKKRSKRVYQNHDGRKLSNEALY